MGIPSRRRIKKELSRRLIYSPFLRLLLLNAFFRTMFLAVAGVGIFFAFYLPKMWTTSPDGFLPVVKVSGLDLTQAWSLKRSARKAESEGNFERANYCWQSAIVNNGADAEAIRGFLNNLLAMSRPERRTTGVALSQSYWLLRMGNTNLADVELSAKVYQKFNWHDVILYTFGREGLQLPPQAEAIYIKSLFHGGRIAEFEEKLRLAESRLNDPSLGLYKQAWLAGWKNGPESVSAMESLALSLQANPVNPLAVRLYMLVNARLGNVAKYSECLKRLADLNEANVLDHIGYWRMLATNGRKEEAITLAKSFATPPGSAMETVQLADMFFALELKEECRDVMKQFAPNFANSPEVWIAYAAVLSNLEDWQELRGIALEMRRVPGMNETLGGYSFYLEGRSELAQERLVTAELAFSRAAESVYDLPAVGLVVARELLKFGYPLQARKILEKIEEGMQERVEYWDSVFAAAKQLKDSDWLLKAASMLHELLPVDPVSQNKYAAALMISRARPEESIRITMQLVASYPNSPTAVVNHGLALLLNNRISEAKGWLESINSKALDPVEQSAYHMALFELYHHLKQYDKAWQALDKILTDQLFPVQLEWLESKRKEMPGRVTGTF